MFGRLQTIWTILEYTHTRSAHVVRRATIFQWTHLRQHALLRQLLVCLLRWGRCHEFESSGSARGAAGMVFCGVRSDSKTRERPVDQILIWASLVKETLPKHKPLFSYSEVKRFEWNRQDGRVIIYIYDWWSDTDIVRLPISSVYYRNPAVGEGLL